MNKRITSLLALLLIMIFALNSNTLSARRRRRRRPRRRFTIGNNKMPKQKSGIKLSPVFYRGIYLHCVTGSKLGRMKRLIKNAKKAGVNCFVIDVAPYKSMRPRINPAVIKECIKNGIYPIARVVAFQYGLKTLKVKKSHLKAIMRLVDLSVKAGFKELQLDYIRFADRRLGIPLKKKYAFIQNLLKMVKDRIKKHNILLATDVFGRIVYNRNDCIGQQLEAMSKYADIICPMVYPSHYYPDRYKISKPFFTVRQSTIKGLNRIGSHTYIMPYIQAFRYNVGYARMSLGKYIIEQVKAVESTASRGYIVWNARNRYNLTFKMLTKYYKKNPNKLSNNPSGYNPGSTADNSNTHNNRTNNTSTN